MVNSKNAVQITYNTGSSLVVGVDLLFKEANDPTIKIIEKINPALPFIKKELPIDDPRQRNPDIRAIKAMTGWEPKISLDEGLDKTIHYFKELNS